MADPWLKFYPQDWRADERLRNCGLSARGLWLEILALMHRSERYGYLLINGKAPTERQLAVQAGAAAEEVTSGLTELEAEGVFSRDRHGTIYSRRMIRDQRKQEDARKHGNEGGNPKLKGGYNKPGFVYLMGPRADGAYKIGISTNPKLRLKKIRAQYRGQDIRIIETFLCDDMGTLEADLHQKYAEKQSGEWFFLSRLDLSEIKGFCGTDKGRREGPEKGQPIPQIPDARSQSSVDKSTAAEPLQNDPVKDLFDLGVSILTQAGVDDVRARSLIGKWRKAKGDGDVLTALIDCRSKAVSEPVEWLEKRLSRARYVSPSGYEYRGNNEAVMREAERRADWDVYWRAKGETAAKAPP